MEQQITVRICDACVDSGIKKPRTAHARCPICKRDICRDHTDHIDIIGVVCSSCRDVVINKLDCRERDTLSQAIIELLTPIIVVKKI